jgi:ATP adenylyltransferase
MAYIRRAEKEGCIFCKRAASREDAKNLILLRGVHAFVMMNRYPYTTGHLMVAPYRHVGSLERLPDEEASEVIRLVAKCEAAIRRALKPDGFNIGANLGKCAGAGFPGHFHMHVVPRWSGDTNFMPVLSETKVLPETLTATYHKIAKAMRAGSPKRRRRQRRKAR